MRHSFRTVRGMCGLCRVARRSRFVPKVKAVGNERRMSAGTGIGASIKRSMKEDWGPEGEGLSRERGRVREQRRTGVVGVLEHL